MKDWNSYLHMIRYQEIERVFGKCPPHAFLTGLELGAGDGYQSSLLLTYVDRLIATDWDTSLLADQRGERLDVCQCDAEAVSEVFPTTRFDLVFSSNVLEHLPNVTTALQGIHTVLNDDGITIHVLPNPAWKLCHLALFYPELVVRKLTRLVSGGAVSIARGASSPRLANNPKMVCDQGSWWRGLWPAPHGAYRGHLQELLAFRKGRWLERFACAGFRVVRVIRGPVCSGYGLQWDRARHRLERINVSTELAYVAVKAGCWSPYERYFADEDGVRA